MKHIIIISVISIMLCATSCTRHDVHVAPVEVKPIHITIDVNVKIDRELDNFFDDIDSSDRDGIDDSSLNNVTPASDF